MLDADNTHIIAGPPGTGKTYRLLEIVEELLYEGARPSDICFIAFTRKAANEAKNRAAVKFGLDSDELPYFRTLHSLAFRQLGLRRNEVMGFGDYCNIAKMLGLSISRRQMSEDGLVAGMSKGDRLLFTEGLARVMDVSLEDLWSSLPNENLDLKELELVAATLVNYKELHGKLDFTDMVYEFLRKEPVPPVKYLIVDEAQDLSAIQWSMIHLLAEHVQRVYLAGDDDQAIFRWAGAEVEYFIDLPGRVEVLHQSYRVPKKVSSLASDIIKQVSHRREKRWQPRDEDGEVIFCNSLEEIDMSEGTWLLLARNTFLLEGYGAYCEMQGYVYSSRAGSIIDDKTLSAIRDWERIRAGKRVTVDQVKNVYSYMTAKKSLRYGAKKKLDSLDKNRYLDFEALCNDFGLVTDRIWHVALDKLSERQTQYFIAALKRGEKLLKEPRIKANTIHGVKGGEADNVVLFVDMAPRTYDEYQENPDDEARVWYVAVTRAKKRLYVINPMTNRYYVDI